MVILFYFVLRIEIFVLSLRMLINEKTVYHNFSAPHIIIYATRRRCVYSIVTHKETTLHQHKNRRKAEVEERQPFR